jgi:phosphatidate phosphatase PAH1
MVYVFDIDGTICTKTTGDYLEAKPIQNRIDMVNKLFEDGNTIIFQTARGMGRSDNSESYAYQAFYELTRQQLKDWGVNFHDLFLGKPAGDIYVDDKGIKDEDFFRNEFRP